MKLKWPGHRAQHPYSFAKRDVVSVMTTKGHTSVYTSSTKDNSAGVVSPHAIIGHSCFSDSKRKVPSLE